jgi:hypothetical protein
MTCRLFFTRWWISRISPSFWARLSRSEASLGDDGGGHLVEGGGQVADLRRRALGLQRAHGEAAPGIDRGDALQIADPADHRAVGVDHRRQGQDEGQQRRQQAAASGSAAPRRTGPGALADSTTKTSSPTRGAAEKSPAVVGVAAGPEREPSATRSAGPPVRRDGGPNASRSVRRDVAPSASARPPRPRRADSGWRRRAAGSTGSAPRRRRRRSGPSASRPARRQHRGLVGIGDAGEPLAVTMSPAGQARRTTDGGAQASAGTVAAAQATRPLRSKRIRLA